MNSKNNYFNSSILILSASWIAKVLSLISTVILARLLTPEDFGLVAITMLIVYFLDIFSHTGTEKYILSKETINNDDINTAWSINISIRVIITLLLLIIAQPISEFFQADITNALRVSSLILIMIGLSNPAISLMKRDLNYQRIFKLALFVKFTSFIITISIAYLTQSYWALIIGTISHYTINMIGSYIIYPFLPKYSLKNFHDQWLFSKWVLLRSFTGYFRSKGDAFILSKFFSTSDIGIFTIGKEFAMLVYEQIAAPISDLVITSIQRAQGNPIEINKSIEKYLLILLSLILPLAYILSLLSSNIVSIILGEQWLAAGPILEVLALLSISASLTMVFSATLTALKRTKLTFYIEITCTILLLITLYLLRTLPINEFAFIRAFLDFFILGTYLLFTSKVIGINLRTTINNMLPALISTGLMALVIIYLPDKFAPDTFIHLVLTITLSLILYTLLFVFFSNKIPNPSPARLELNQTINRFILNKLSI